MSEFVKNALAILGDIGPNRRHLRDLEDCKPQIVPFVGAGLSMPFGYPAWGGLLKQLAPGDEVRTEVETLLRYFKYEEAADRIHDELAPREFRAKIQDLLKDRDTTPNAVHALPAITPDLVITTNLDGVLEQVFEKAGKRFQSVFNGGALRDASGAIQRRDRVLLKLHGDVADAKTWILTLDQYRNAYGEPNTDMEKPLPKLLRQAITGRVLLFLGCSLQTDRTMRVLHDVVKDLGLEHYALLPEAENTGPRLDQFRQWQIKPIFFAKGQYHKITEFLRCLAEQKTSAPVPQDIESLVARARARVAPSIRARCGFMKILDMEQPIELGSIYTDVNILEKRTANRLASVEEFQKVTAAADFDRFGLPDKQDRIPGFDAVGRHKRLVIYGKPGAGKTTFLKRLAFQCIEDKYRPDLVPVFVTLLDFANEKTSPSLERYLSSQMSGIDAARIMAEGRMLVLLDGLDEVGDDDFHRVRQAIVRVTEKYPETPVVMTCRIAAREYNFQTFIDVEMADFDRAQIDAFAQKWFAAKTKPERSEGFLQRLNKDKRLAELANKPLLLTMLCMIFEESGSFDGSRAGLYQEGLDLLLKKWDATRDIQRRSEIPIESLRGLLEDIAYSRFLKGEYFFSQDSLEADIHGFLQSRSVSVHAERALAICESNLGLIVQRARRVYSFSHLTFQEFFTARRIHAHPDLLSRAAQHLGESRWNEVWLLLANSKDPEYLIPQLKLHTDSLVSGDSRLQAFLEWLQRKTLATRAPVRKSASRAFYASLDRDLALDRALDRDLDLDRYRDRARDLALDLDLDLALALDLARALARALDLDRARALARALDRARALAPQIKPALAHQLRHLANNQPDWRDQRAVEQWTESLRAVIIRHRDIGHDWNFSPDQQQKLDQYLRANRLLIQCMNEAPSLTTATRERIKDEMLLPYATLYPAARSQSAP